MKKKISVFVLGGDVTNLHPLTSKKIQADYQSGKIKPEKIILQHNVQIEELERIHTIVSIQEMVLCDVYHIFDNGLNYLPPKLKILKIDSCKNLTNKSLKTVSTSASISTLVLRFCDGFTDLFHLTESPSIRKLSLEHLKNISMKGITEYLPQMKTLESFQIYGHTNHGLNYNHIVQLLIPSQSLLRLSLPDGCADTSKKLWNDSIDTWTENQQQHYENILLNTLAKFPKTLIIVILKMITLPVRKKIYTGRVLGF